MLCIFEDFELPSKTFLVTLMTKNLQIDSSRFSLYVFIKKQVLLYTDHGSISKWRLLEELHKIKHKSA